MARPLAHCIVSRRGATMPCRGTSVGMSDFTCAQGSVQLIGRKSRMASLKATDAQGPSECGRELCRTEFVRDSKVGLSLNIPLQIACGCSRLQSCRLRFLPRFGPKT